MERLGDLTDINLQVRGWARTQRYTHVATCKGQKRAFNSYEVGTVAVSLPMWELGTKPWFPRREAGVHC